MIVLVVARWLWLWWYLWIQFGGDRVVLINAVVVMVTTLKMVVVVMKGHEIESEGDEGVDGEGRDEVEVEDNEVEGDT